MKIWNIGYPRIGRQKELTAIVDSFLKNQIKDNELLSKGSELLRSRWETQHNLGVDSIPLNDFSFCDPILDTAQLFNLIPEIGEEKKSWLLDSFVLTGQRTLAGQLPLKLAKWFNTNYHVSSPEVNAQTKFSLKKGKLHWELEQSKAVPYNFHVTLVGPWTLAKYCRLQGITLPGILAELAPLYKSLINEIHKKGIQWIQLEEPALCQDLDRSDLKTIQKTYESFEGAASKIMLSLAYESPDPWLTDLALLPVHGFHFDLVSGPATFSWIKTRSFPRDKILCLGLVDARNVWAAPLSSLYKQIEILKGFHPVSKMMVAPSASLTHLPICKKVEVELKKKEALFRSLSFADQRLEELAQLKMVLLGEADAEGLQKAETLLRQDLKNLHKVDEGVQKQINKIEPTMKRRTSSFAKRFKAQSKKLGLPRLPCTTVGSFPQTDEIVEARKRAKEGADRESYYHSLIKMEIAKAIDIQESVGMDVLVHGECERSDVVEYFAAQLAGFSVTEHGWVQCLGTHCVRPPIIVSDIQRKEPMSLLGYKMAQELTPKPVKAIVTGPVTLVNWSFVRQDQPQEKTALQAALAIRAELKELERFGAKIIQIDEPGIKEGLPIKKGKRPNYLRWVTDVFRLATSGVQDETQIQTHLCLNDLSELIEAVGKFDSDVFLIETSRSNGNLLSFLKTTVFESSIGPGIYDVHSRHVPTVNEFELSLRKCFEVLAPEKIWVVPDCGLRTRTHDEVRQALANMVESAKRIRKLLG
ncbi:MAG: 5-methyltetrahydropteroyltriglutamate--homocysteine S-methyltransferase [Proteobacteria bacterium]|nr:5-methyltetrahydropteroyltriglutamate--homocysteine S-methyltransferase [Pseudomonadota bacterium]